ncbi:MAG: OadG family protein [Desulfobacterales bacterium]|jgi:sodium pump decarboxylase gamma subunit|nr:OadG family protein [Desulfobacterales bacterium]
MDTWAKLEIGFVMTLLGMGIVFAVLVFLAAVLGLLEKACTPRRPKAQPPAPATAPAAGDPPALAAVIAAAIAAFTGESAPPAIRSIRRAGEELPAWSRMSRQEQLASRKIR